MFRTLRRLIATGLALSAATGAYAANEAAFSPVTYERTVWAYDGYLAAFRHGGWPALPQGLGGLREGSSGPAVSALKARLVLLRDLAPEAARGDQFDNWTLSAVKRFQARHGLNETGVINPATLKELEVPLDQRLKQLYATLQRMRRTSFTFPDRYVVLNIPGATIEAVDHGAVEQRHTAVVGRPDRPSPLITARISSVNINPFWTVPTSIVKNDLGPRMQADPAFLTKNRMHVFLANGQEIAPNSIDWSRKAPNVTVRQEPGPTNSLGVMRLDMPNIHSVYMHDTPQKDLFRSDARFHSSGCARVQDVRGLAAWLLSDTDWTRERLDSAVASGQGVDVRLPRPVPVVWVYLTGWAAPDGTIQFRDDIYSLDDADANPNATPAADPAPVASNAPAPRAIGDLIQTGSIRRR